MSKPYFAVLLVLLLLPVLAAVFAVAYIWIKIGLTAGITALCVLTAAVVSVTCIVISGLKRHKNK